MRVVSDGEHRQVMELPGIMEVYPNVAILLQVKYVHPVNSTVLEQ